jgi:transaldolase
MVIYLDSGDLKEISALASSVAGFTTNPSLMKQSGIANYRGFAKEVLSIIGDKPVSFEVFANEALEMEKQAREIASWSSNIYVKIPVTNIQGEASKKLIQKLARKGLKINVTAVMTTPQIESVCRWVVPRIPAILSIFAGRIADTGINPVPVIRRAIGGKYENTKILWASAREVLNVKQAEDCGCDIITLAPSLVRKLPLLGKDLTQYSLETVRQFYDDAKGLTL